MKITTMNYIIRSLLSMFVQRRYLRAMPSLTCAQDRPDINSCVSLHLRNRTLKTLERLKIKLEMLSDHTCNTSDYFQYSLLHRKKSVIVIASLVEILNIPEIKAMEAFSECSNRREICRLDVINNYYELLNNEVDRKIIVENAWLLLHKHDVLKNKINCIQVLQIDISELFPLFQLSMDVLLTVAEKLKQQKNEQMNKIEYLAYRLQCSEWEISQMFASNLPLLHIPQKQLKEVINIYNEYNIQPETILAYPIILSCKPITAKQRLDQLKTLANLVLFKPWYLYCAHSTFTRLLEERIKECKVILKEDNLNDYLMSKLNISEAAAKAMIKKRPALNRFVIKKLDDTINLLLEYGYTASEIVHHPRVFTLGKKKLRWRLEMLKNIDNCPKRMSLVSGSTKFFEERVVLWRKSDD